MRATITLLTSCILLIANGRDAAAAARKIVLPSGGQRTEAYLAEPEGEGPCPAVLFLHGGRGGIVGGDPQQSLAALARAGYVALAPMRLKQNTLRAEITQTRGALEYLRKLDRVDPKRVAVVGFSRGGLLALIAAVKSPELRAAILMAPAAGRGALSRALAAATKNTAPTLILVSGNDSAQADHVEIARTINGRLKQVGADSQLTVYPAYRSDGHQLFFKVRATYWKDLVAFLDTHLQASKAQ
ncbi:MAG: alpha/beta fold hydrolase [Pirellulales bacterium]|jgi:dienelactone hydrolase|nr:alpha/beta fold hydrolase [Pirellulales bacterium]